MSRNFATRKRTNRMSVVELAEVMECSEATAYQMAEQGMFGSFRLGRSYFISRAAVENWLAGHFAKAPQNPPSKKHGRIPFVVEVH